MLCPSCQNTMREREKGDVIIDICPGCRGIWLDAGELEKLIESQCSHHDRDGDEGDNVGRRGNGSPRRVEHYRGRSDAETYPRKRGNFLSNVFEAFGGEGGN